MIRTAEASNGIAARALATVNGGARLPQSYEAARQALSNCASIDECQSWADKAAALASYAKQAKDEELMKMAVRIRDRAIRRAGELYKQIPEARGANQNITSDSGPKVLTRKDAAEQVGMSDRQMKTAIRVANVPAEQFDAQVDSDNPPTVTALAEQGKKPSPVFYPGPDHYFPAGRPQDVIRAPRTGNEHHPTEKPVQLMQAFVEWTAGTVLDMFMGSGSTLVACARAGRLAIGIELHEPYFETACQRVADASRRPDMFVQRAPEPKQEGLAL